MIGRNLPLRHRAMLAFGLSALAVSSVVAVASYELTRWTLVDQRERVATRQAYLNARSLRGAITSDPLDPAEALGRVQTSSGGLALLRVDGEWFSTSVSGGRSDVPASLIEAVDEGAVARQRTSTAQGPAVYVGIPLAGTDAVYVEMLPFDEVAESLRRVAWGSFLAVLAATGAGIVAGRALSSRILRPVRRAADAADVINRGALDRRLDDERDPDLQPLVRSFNEMVDGLQTRIDREARFASDVTHELRSPLATMDAALRMARRGASERTTTEALDVLGTELTRFRELIVDLLEIGRAEAGVAELVLDEVDVGVLAGAVLEATHRRGVALEVRSEGPPTTLLDKRRIGQTLVNLLDNADNYGGGATGLTVVAEAETIRFVVDDDGPGIPEHEREYVFQRFARGTEARTSGTGLGLALVHEHVRLHGGTVSIHDAPSGGARLVVAIPRRAS